VIAIALGGAASLVWLRSAAPGWAISGGRARERLDRPEHGDLCDCANRGLHETTGSSAGRIRDAAPPALPLGQGDNS
jgi:hypothetical protein